MVTTDVETFSPGGLPAVPGCSAREGEKIKITVTTIAQDVVKKGRRVFGVISFIVKFYPGLLRNQLATVRPCVSDHDEAAGPYSNTVECPAEV
jgi:hypothetical protein